MILTGKSVFKSELVLESLVLRRLSMKIFLRGSILFISAGNEHDGANEKPEPNA